MGFKFINKTFKQYYDVISYLRSQNINFNLQDIVHIKTANVMNMVDLAREERVKKYDKLIDEFDAITKKERIRKLAAKHKDEVFIESVKLLTPDNQVGEMAGRLLNDLDTFLIKIKAR